MVPGTEQTHLCKKVVIAAVFHHGSTRFPEKMRNLMNFRIQ